MHFSFQIGVSDTYLGCLVRACHRTLEWSARERTKDFCRRKSWSARAKGQKFCRLKSFSLDHAVAFIMVLRWVGSAGHIFPTPELDSQHYVCFDRHAIAVTTIGDDRNKSFYLPQKHLSIYNTKDLFLHAPPPADHNIMLPPTARQHAACLFWSPFNSSANGSRSPQ